MVGALGEGRDGVESVTVGSAEGGVSETDSVTAGSVFTVDDVGGVVTEAGDGEGGSGIDAAAGGNKDDCPPSF